MNFYLLNFIKTINAFVDDAPGTGVQVLANLSYLNAFLSTETETSPKLSKAAENLFGDKWLFRSLHLNLWT